MDLMKLSVYLSHFTFLLNVGTTSMFASHHLDFHCLEYKLKNVVSCHKVMQLISKPLGLYRINSHW